MRNGYASSQLNPGEEIVHAGQLHWITFFNVVPLILLITVLLAVFGSAVGIILPGALCLVVMIALIWDWIRLRTTEMVITNRRVIYKTGLIVRNTHEQLLGKIENIKLQQGLIGRVLGYGTLELIGTGGSPVSLRLVDNVEGFKNKLSAALSSAHTAAPPAPP